MRRVVLLLPLLLGAVGAMGGYCPEGEPANPQDVRAKGKDVDIFSDLTVEEMKNVLDYMNQRSGLRIASWARGTLNDSWIYLVEALPPRKADALRYLDMGGAKPSRYAKVIVYRGDLIRPVIQEVKVGPLPDPDHHDVIKNPHYMNPIPYHARSPMADHELRMWETFLRQELNKIDRELQQATDGYSFNKDCGEKCLTWFPNVPGQWETGTHKMWVNFFRNLEGYYLHPIGLQVRVDGLSLDIARWRIDYVWWRGTEFNDMEDLINAMNRNQAPLNKIPEPADAHEKTLYSSLNFRGDPLPKEPQRGPKSYLPDGRRYKVEGHRVSWQGWEFNFGVSSVQGLHVNDVRFLGDRVVYELAIQELAAFYSGKSPLAMHTSFYDSFIHIGRETYTLFRGLDCPDHATFFDMVHYMNGEAFVIKDSVCVFERDIGTPVRRHYESDHKGGYYWVQGMPGNNLVVRAITTAYNYEYITDVIFHQTGGIETKVTLSGYILPTFFTGDSDDSQGFEVFKDGVGNIHHHIVNVKVDLDIKGTKNSFETLDIKSKKFKSNAEDTYIYGKYFEHNQRSFEKDAIITPKPDKPSYLLMYNNDATNKFGNNKAYRIQAVHGTSILFEDDWKMARSGAWAMNHVHITKRKEEEQCSSSVYSSPDAFEPVMSFEDYYKDNENIEQEDLVAWVTLGTIHIPHTEDIPIVTTQNVQLTMHLTPYNYFDEDPSLASRDNIKIYPDDNGEPEYEYAGVNSFVDCKPLSGGSILHASLTTILLVVFARWMI